MVSGISLCLVVSHRPQLCVLRLWSHVKAQPGGDAVTHGTVGKIQFLSNKMNAKGPHFLLFGWRSHLALSMGLSTVHLPM